MNDRNTYGPAYDEQIDGERVGGQMADIKHFMLAGGWRTLNEISNATGHPESSISAQLRHLRKEQFGSYDVQKRRRNLAGGTWEYRVKPGAKAGEQVGIF